VLFGYLPISPLSGALLPIFSGVSFLVTLFMVVNLSLPCLFCCRGRVRIFFPTWWISPIVFLRSRPFRTSYIRGCPLGVTSPFSVHDLFHPSPSPHSSSLCAFVAHEAPRPGRVFLFRRLGPFFPATARHQGFFFFSNQAESFITTASFSKAKY